MSQIILVRTRWIVCQNIVIFSLRTMDYLLNNLHFISQKDTLRDRKKAYITIQGFDSFSNIGKDLDFMKFSLPFDS